MKNNVLSPRLKSIVSFVEKNCIIADIGTDHARVPIYLLQNGIISYAIASDIGEGPLEKAKENLQYFNLTDKVSLRLADGFKGIKNNEADCGIIAGMGGEVISQILNEYIPISINTLILQPMTDSHFVRKAVADLGFTIEKEDIVIEKDKMYIVILCRKGKNTITEKEQYISPALKKHPLFKEYLAYRLKRMKNAATNAQKAGANTLMLKEYEILNEEYKINFD
ncbi:MAG: SAM-dependent methyltransferase [Clostridia bacterium]|nr:SAM-dependent methyltransferase [Clostridia bacterium]